jgi:hypothetical protein
MKNLNIAVGLVLFTGLAVGSYRLIGAPRASAQTEKTGASPSELAAVVPDNSERTLRGATDISLRHLRRRSLVGRYIASP